MIHCSHDFSARVQAVGTNSRLDWMAAFRGCFVVLFVAYPGVSAKIMHLFRCQVIENEAWLVADMRLKVCSTVYFVGVVLLLGGSRCVDKHATGGAEPCDSCSSE
jgi:hypothetical protein